MKQFAFIDVETVVYLSLLLHQQRLAGWMGLDAACAIYDACSGSGRRWLVYCF